MQYFFVTEDSRDFRWQTELLLESLRLLNLESQTFVAICPGPGANGNPPCNNLVRFDNVGSKIRCPQFNKVEGLRKALEQGVLKQPFVVLDADMFLLRDVPRATGQIAAQVLPRLAWETVKPILGEHVDEWVGVGLACAGGSGPSHGFGTDSKIWQFRLQATVASSRMWTQTEPSRRSSGRPIGVRSAFTRKP